MTRYFYIDAEGKQKGTFSAEEFCNEPIHADTLVWTQGWNKWIRVADVAELQNVYATVGNPPPVPCSTPAPVSGQVSYQPFVVTSVQSNPSNGIGIAGFALALIALFLWWLPFLGWLLWFLGLAFSFAGAFRKPRGLAIAGLCISLIGIILLLLLGAFILTAAGLGSLA